MKLKPAGIIIIVLIIAALAYFAIRPRVSESTPKNSTSISNTPNNQDSNSLNSSSSTSSAGDTKTESREFNYTPEKPENGTLRGVVELGATGFNSFIVNMDNQKRWEIVSKDFGESLAYEGLATTEDIRAGLKKYSA